MTSNGNKEEFGIFVQRFMNFLNIWIIYTDLSTGRYVPSVGTTLETANPEAAASGREFPVDITVMFLLHAYFYSLVEDSEDGLNGFRLLHDRHPEEDAAISAVEAQVAPFRERLRVFRNRLGFHGSRSRAHESRGFELFEKHSADEILDCIGNFKSLGAALLAKENVRQGIETFTAEQVREWIDAVTERAKKQLAEKVPA